MELCKDDELQGKLKLSPPVLSAGKLASFVQVWAGQIRLTHRVYGPSANTVNPPTLALPLLYLSNHILLTSVRTSKSSKGVPATYLASIASAFKPHLESAFEAVVLAAGPGQEHLACKKALAVLKVWHAYCPVLYQKEFLQSLEERVRQLQVIIEVWRHDKSS